MVYFQELTGVLLCDQEPRSTWPSWSRGLLEGLLHAAERARPRWPSCGACVKEPPRSALNQVELVFLLIDWYCLFLPRNEMAGSKVSGERGFIVSAFVCEESLALVSLVSLCRVAVECDGEKEEGR